MSRRYTEQNSSLDPKRRHQSTLINKRSFKSHKKKMHQHVINIFLQEQSKSHPRNGICLLIWLEVGGEGKKEEWNSIICTICHQIDVKNNKMIIAPNQGWRSQRDKCKENTAVVRLWSRISPQQPEKVCLSHSAWESPLTLGGGNASTSKRRVMEL